MSLEEDIAIGDGSYALGGITNGKYPELNPRDQTFRDFVLVAGIVLRASADVASDYFASYMRSRAPSYLHVLLHNIRDAGRDSFLARTIERLDGEFHEV